MSVSDNFLRVARALAQIREQRFVYAGASMLPLLINDPAAPPPRFTVDVDAVVDVLTYDQWDRLRSRLADCGIVVRADAMGKSRLCLFYMNGIEVDIIPTRMPLILPASRMLELGFQFAEPYRIEEKLEILGLSASCFLAAKLEAFQDRGLQDLLLSKDLEDIVTLLDCRMNFESEIIKAPDEVRYYIASSMRGLINNGLALDVIADLLRNSERERKVIQLIRALAGMGR